MARVNAVAIEEVESQEVPEVATFFSWMGVEAQTPENRNPRSYPSSQIIHISGGERVITSDGGRALAPLKEAKFHNGILQTDDPEIIAGLRKMIQSSARRGQQCNISEDREEYYLHTMTRDQVARRATALNEVTKQQLREAYKENDRLRTLLEEKSKEPKR